MNASELKASLLQQAIEGKLVPQRQEDGVVEQIGDPPTDVPFAIPSSWKWVQLRTVGQIVSGGTPKTSVSNYWNGNISWITPADMGKNSSKWISAGSRNITKLGLAESSATLMPAGSIVYSSRAPIGHIAIAQNELCTNQGCKSFIPNNKLIISGWAYYMLIARTPDIQSRASGTTFKEISGKGVGNTWITLPPLEEQKRIVGKLEELLPLVEEYGQAYDKLHKLNTDLPSKLKASILQEAIQGKLVAQLPEDGVVEQIGEAPTDVPFAIPSSWKWIYLSHLTSLITDGSHNPPPNIGEGIPVLSAKDLKHGILSDASASRWTNEVHWGPEFKRCPVQYDDIVLCIVGSIGKVGRSVVKNKIMLQRSLALIKVHESLILKDYLEIFLNSVFCQQWLLDHAAGTAQKGIYLRTLKVMPVVIPPLEEQKRIVAKVEELLEHVESLSQK